MRARQLLIFRAPGVVWQSAEEIEALVVDEDMPELDRFALLFDRGRPIQRLSVMLNLPPLVAEHGPRAREREE